MIKKKWLKRIGALTLAMSMILGSGTVNATENTSNPGVIDTSKRVTLTIHKYEVESMDQAGAPGNGTTDVVIPDGAMGLPGVTFAVYKVAADTLETEIPDGAEPVATKTTGEDGTATFNELAQGRYLVVETAAPDKVYEKCANFLVDLPMMNAAGNGWIYDVHAYPKNAAVLGAVVLTKTDKDSQKVLAGAEFKLQQLVGNEYQDMKDAQGNVRIFTTDANGKIAVNGLFKGTYQFVETKAPAEYGINTTPISFVIDKNATVAEDGTQSKNVVEVGATDVKTPVIEKDADKDSANLGDTVTWTLTPSVPSDIAGYKKFEVTDVLDYRLTYKADSLKVYLNGTEVTSGFTSDTTNGVNVTFTDFAMLAGKKLTIEFQTIIADSVAENPGNITNTGSISYENAYGTTGEAESNPVDVYVGNICVLKYEEGNKANVLAGAKFALYKTEADAKAGKNQIGVTVTTDAEGKAYFKGLETGDYWLVEKESPTYTDDGVSKHYLLMTAPQKVTVSADDEDGMVTIGVANKKQGFSIPKTGGAGTLIFLFAGIMMISGATIVFIARKKREAE